MIMLSIIVPVFNKELYIDECINSILNQSYTAFELILVDDGSTDRSGEKCEYYATLDPRITVLKQVNKGVSEARNLGIDHAKGLYIGFVDSDDTIEPDMYALLIKNALASNADISACRVRTIKDGKSKRFSASGLSVFNHVQALSAFLKGNLDHNANNKIFHTKIIAKLRFKGVIYEDILFACQAFLNANQSIIENVQKYNYTIRSNSTSMKGFNANYFETVMVSAKMVQLVASDSVECLPQAMAFDVMANISLLNLLLLLPNVNAYALEYKKVVATLTKYGSFIKTSKEVRVRHKYAWLIFSVSPLLYRYSMHAFCLITGADVIKRTQ